MYDGKSVSHAACYILTTRLPSIVSRGTFSTLLTSPIANPRLRGSLFRVIFQSSPLIPIKTSGVVRTEHPVNSRTHFTEFLSNDRWLISRSRSVHTAPVRVAPCVCPLSYLSLGFLSTGDEESFLKTWDPQSTQSWESWHILRPPRELS